MPHKEEISARTLDAIMGSVLDAVVAVDKDSIVVAWNGSAEQTFGWTREEAIGRGLGELIIPPRHRDGHRAGMERYHATGVASVLNRRI
jgi:PAS domain S-box-containing protein